MLADTDIALLETSVMKPEDLLKELAEVCNDGYKVSIVQDNERKSVKVLVQDVKIGRYSCGWMLSAESETVQLALLVMLYKHTAIMARDWVPFLTKTHQVSKYR